MAEKKDEPLARRERLERLLDLAVELAELADDQKTNRLLEGRMRMIAAGLRADATVRGRTGREDNMSVNDELSDEARMARADDIRADIERRLARIRELKASQSVAEAPGSGED
ncbi:MAG: hypothetical protein ACM3YN_02425 [Parcubacteria group bacterium]